MTHHGPPRTATTKTNVAAVENLIKQDGRFTVKKKLADNVGISSRSVQKISTQVLVLKKAWWAPCPWQKNKGHSCKNCQPSIFFLNSRNIDNLRSSELLTGDETYLACVKTKQ